jgi:hypothetical protein
MDTFGIASFRQFETDECWFDQVFVAAGSEGCKAGINNA